FGFFPTPKRNYFFLRLKPVRPSAPMIRHNPSAVSPVSFAVPVFGNTEAASTGAFLTVSSTFGGVESVVGSS
ncbi:hypothetical protein D822_09725, partial [Streptococcus ratti FA-1 = DSM 20564]